jgi:GST-like protein
MIKLYGGGTPNVHKVLIMLAETGLPYEVEHVDVMAEQQFRPEFVALNPNSKIPVIVDNDGPAGGPHSVFESGAILIYLAEKTGRFLPTDPVARSRTLQWLMFQMASVGPMFGQALHFSHAAPKDKAGGNDYAVHRYLTEVRRLYGVLERQLSANDYVAGAEYGIADMAVYPWAGRYRKHLGVGPEEFPRVAEWTSRLEARPGVAAVAGAIRDLLRAGRDATAQAKPHSMDRFYGRGRYLTA